MGLIVAGRPPRTQYRTEVVEERTEQWAKLVGILFCAPSSKVGKDEILPNLAYFHHRSGMFVDFFCVGYEESNDPQCVAVVGNSKWNFNAQDFTACLAQLERD